MFYDSPRPLGMSRHGLTPFSPRLIYVPCDPIGCGAPTARIRATLSKPLNQDDVAFLHQQQRVRIVREGSRVALKGRRDDYLQVYAVIDVHTGKALAYAHFHYVRRQGPDDHFTAAHLKTPEQAKLGRQAQAEAQAFARMRIGQTGRVQQTLEIHRSEIQLPLARRLFFSVD